MSEARNSRPLVTTLQVIGIIAGLFFSLFMLEAYVDRKIERAVNHPDYIRRIAENVRPSMIFDTEDVIIVDMGATHYVENVHVESDSTGMPVSIHVDTRQWLAHAPIITGADEALYLVQERRGPGTSWDYDLKVTIYNLSHDKGAWKMDFPGEPDRPLRFRLEVVR